MRCTTIIKYISIAVISAAMLVFYGCAKELDELGGMKPSEVISFTTDVTALTKSTNERIAVSSHYTGNHLSITEQERSVGKMQATHTKAAPLMQLDGEEAQVIGYSIDENNNTSMKFNQSFEFDGEILINTGKPIYWKSLADATQLKTYAYTPKDINADVNSAPPTLSYIVPETPSEQKDITVATAQVAGNYRMSIPLQFEHIFTAIQFKVGFSCKVKSLTLSGVKNSGTYTFGDGWDNLSGSGNYKVYNSNEGVDFAKDAYLNNGANTLMLLPQEFDSSSEAKVVLEYLDGTEAQSITASLAGQKWEAGRMITYTIHKDAKPEYIYFDLAAGMVDINNTSYSGYIYADGVKTGVSGTHNNANIYYVYQSTEANQASTGKVNGKFVLPDYPDVMVGTTPWSKFITNNTNVEEVIETWDDGKNVRSDNMDAPDENRIGTAVVREANRTHTKNYIKITGSNAKYNLTIDNIYSVIQQPVNSTQAFRKRSLGGIAYIPDGGTELTVNFIGDNRMGCLHIDNNSTDKIILQGTGSLTAADTDFLTVKCVGDYKSDFGDTKGYISNFWNSAIGNNTDDETGEKVYNLYIRSGVIFAGATKTEDCTAIGGGGNGYGQVYIEGGTITAVATTAGTAIGGGMGHSAHGGPGEVHISGGNVYAYNLANQWGIPSSAVGGGGSMINLGSNGIVRISGGNIYAYSALGTAIGGGSSSLTNGGGADIEITGGYITAKSGQSNGIGGGMGGTNQGAYGGGASIKISGTPIIRTGSVGGGRTKNNTGTIGTANIEISGNPDIQAQFVMAKGADISPKFSMNGGTIRNSHTSDKEYIHIQDNGGAVYMEDGELEMTGGTITNCSAVEGGAIYITGGNAKISGTAAMTNNLASAGNGGAICIYDGNLEMSGSANVSNNASQHRPLTEGAAATGGNGGGIYVSSSDNATVSILQGTIKDNTADRNGGGIAVDMSANNDKTARITIGEAGAGDTDPDISGNTSLILGGGLYASGAKADITINSGKIMDNSTSGYTYNVNVANEGGTVTLNGGNVTHQTVTFNANGGNINGAATAQQKIVTSTNSLLNAPVPTRTGYNFNGWNTRQDGNGTPYADGATMDLSADLTLYAQWQIIQ